jgi:hypothetical protein
LGYKKSSFFKKYHLITQKKADFLLFKEAAYMLNQKKHLTELGIKNIVDIKASINLGLSPKFKMHFLYLSLLTDLL